MAKQEEEEPSGEGSAPDLPEGHARPPAEAEPPKGVPSLPAGAPEELSSEEYECRICYNLFDLERHAPKLLECLHTFCLECLHELHLRSSPGGGRPGGPHYSPGGGRAPGASSPSSSVTCPVCRHRTALPDGLPHSLPVNTRLVEAILLQLRGWAPLLRDLHPQRLLLLPPRSPSAGPSPPSPPSHEAATPSSATVTFGHLEGGRCGAEEEGAAEEEGGCVAKCREKAGCVCFVFLVLAMALFGFAWMEWLTGSIFLGVALVLLFASTMPFMYGFRLRSEPRTIFYTRAGGGGGGGSREGTSCRSTPGSRPALDGRSHW